ncbi:DUF2637 domain-containing protein [Micromonospora sp. NPDC049891]|uniref:DUF2637 domain-containing protein n=1 Tax=Micromonospora sp. NPDC049891 TaxID=3155655 RepID=UPI0033E0F1BC
MTTDLKSLKRLRWAVRLVLALGVAASIAGNVLHARDNLISQIVSAWSPLALLLTIELISRVPVHRKSLAVVRWVATSVVAGIAAWVSYWHMASVASHYGETGGSQYLIPFSVDGLVVVASISLVELGGRIRAAESAGQMPDRKPVVTEVKPRIERPPVVPAGVRLLRLVPVTVPDSEPVKPPAARVSPQTAEKVMKALRSVPDGRIEEVARRAKVSERTVRRALNGVKP